MTFSTLWGLLSPRLNYTGMKWASYSLSCCLYSHLLQLPSYYRCDHTQPLSLFICRQLVQHILSTSVVPLNPSMLSCSFLHQHMTPIVDTNVASFLNLVIPSTNATHGHFSLNGKLAWLCIRWHAFLHDWKEKSLYFYDQVTLVASLTQCPWILSRPQEFTRGRRNGENLFKLGCKREQLVACMLFLGPQRTRLCKAK
jgi:hypothetical protein